jgi:hypothetical protein
MTKPLTKIPMFIHTRAGRPFSPALGSVRNAHASIASATSDNSPTTLIRGTPPTLPLTGEDSNNARCR